MELGMSFSPTTAAIDKQQQADAASGGNPTPIQDAIKLLSLRIPNFRSQGGVASLPLLQGQGSLGVMGGQNMPGGFQQILAQLFGGQGMNPSGSMGGSAPTPNVVIGANGHTQTGPMIPGSEGPNWNVGQPSGGVTNPGQQGPYTGPITEPQTAPPMGRGFGRV